MTSRTPAAGMMNRRRGPRDVGWCLEFPSLIDAHRQCRRFTASRKRHHRSFRDSRFQERVSGDEKRRKRVAPVPASAGCLVDYSCTLFSTT